MSLPEIISYDKDGEVEGYPLFRKLFLSLVIILVATLSFGIGRLSVVVNREPVRIEYDSRLTTDGIQPATLPEVKQLNQAASVINALERGSVVVSKNGTRYHFSHCPGAKQIKEENRILFPTPAAAEAAGFSLAANCRPQ